MQLRELSKGMSPLMMCIVLIMTMFLIVDVASASYKKPPFNGSIFGKRSNSGTDYESAGRTLSSLCEIASEACTAWFPQLEAKKKERLMEYIITALGK